MKRLKQGMFVLLLLIAGKLSAQVDTTYNPAKTYTQTQLLEDLTFLKNVLVEAHASLYRYQSKAALDSTFLNATALINKPMTEIEFWRVLQPVIAGIRSGHTGLFYSRAHINWQNKYPVDHLTQFLTVEDDKLLLRIKSTKDTSKRYILTVKSIDGLPTDQIISTLKKYVSGEGLSEQWTNYQLQGGSFSFVYGNVFGYKPVYDLEVVDTLNKHSILHMKAFHAKRTMGADQIKQQLEKTMDELDKVVSVDYPAGVPLTAVLKIKGFSYFNYYLSFHEQFFKRMQDDKIKNLVIDIRGNTGGLAVIGGDLMRYLVKNEFTQVEAVQVPVNKITFNDYILHDAGNDMPQKTTDKVQPYDYSWHQYPKLYPAAEYHFDKKIYLLVDKGTFSAGSIFAASLKNQCKVTVIGEETGGAEAGSDGGFSTIKLPNSRLLLHLPRFWESTTASNHHSKHGLIPDIVVKNHISTTKNNDAVMKKVKELILDSK
ncbi:Peptidase family S41 [Mucilaginibacter sp. OK268]|uniref:S41 family peptidase n=1 Tax=Mucilaginibacter sp. OK268 TaxID=1881048 RepID=UPI00087F6921|nr:S41 family peptidase [Mucilaginibacter sp. OK268]SDP57566.1 Peptidase family S41 [Mucilaginibacter sp. OK268]